MCYAYLNPIHYFIFNKKSILTVKATEKLDPSWIYIRRNREKKTFYLNQLKALSIQWVWDNETWLHYSWGHLHLSSESLPGPFIALTSSPVLPSHSLWIKLNINEWKQPGYRKLSQEYWDRQEKRLLFLRKHLLRVLGSQKSGQNGEKWPLNEDK